MALVNSGLFFNLSAEVVSSQEGNCLRALVGTSDCGKSLLVEGVELPSATLTPDIAIALPTRGMGPSLIGGVRIPVIFNQPFFTLLSMCMYCL